MISGWALPAVLVAQEDCALRFCAEYHNIYSLSRKNVYRSLRIAKCVEKLGKDNLFTTLDKLNENTRWNIRIKLMLLGLSNSVSNFHCKLDIVLSKFKIELVFFELTM